MDVRIIAELDPNRRLTKRPVIGVPSPTHSQCGCDATCAAVIMGRVTDDLQTIEIPPSHPKIVLSTTRQSNDDSSNTKSYTNSIPDALSKAHSHCRDTVYILGGEQIFRQFLPYASHLHITRQDNPVHTDNRFPELIEEKWELRQMPKNSPNGPQIYKRVVEGATPQASIVPKTTH